MMEAELHIGLTTKDLEHHGRALAHKLDEMKDPKPRFLRRAAALNNVGSFNYLTLGGPPLGYYWTLRSLTTYAGLDPFYNPSGAFAMFVGNPPVGASPVSDAAPYPYMMMSNLVVTSIDPPTTIFFSEGAIKVFPGEEIVFLFSIAETTQIGANVTLNEYPLEPTIRRNYPQN
jgi:hypothetical protein